MPEQRLVRSEPTVTISLVTYNGLRWLPGCLTSLRTQSLAPLELLVLDNASTDGTAEWLRAEAARDARLVLVESRENLGFAAAHNRNIFAARAEFVCLLNQDVELDERFLEEATKPFAHDERLAAVQARLRRLGANGARLQVLDSTGLVMERDHRVASRAQGELDGAAHSIAGPVWGADGPAPVYRRSALLDARLPATRGGWEILDEDFFMYKEDVDLGWRLRLLGWTARYAPAAVAWHARGAGGSGARGYLASAMAGRSIPRYVKQLSWRNHRLMEIKNAAPGEYVRDLPWIARREALSLGWMLLTDQARLLHLPQLFVAAPTALAKRRYLQRARARADRTYAPPAHEGRTGRERSVTGARR